MENTKISSSTTRNCVENKKIMKSPANMIFLFSIIIICTISFFSFLQFDKLNSSNALVSHTYQVMQVTGDLLYDITDIELQQKNYLLDGDINLLSHIGDKILNTNKSLGLLINLTNNNASQNSRSIALSKEINEHFDALSNFINKNYYNKLSSQDKVFLFKNGQAKLYKLNYMLNEIQNIEYDLLRQRSEKAINDTSKVNLIFILGEITSVMFLLVAFYLFNRELLKRALAEEKIKNIESQLRGVIEGASDMIAAIDLDYNYMVFNSAYQNEFKILLGKEITTGDNINDVFSQLPQVKAKLLENWKWSFEGKEYIKTIDFEVTKKDKNTTYEVTSSLIKNEQNSIQGAVHIIRDVTEHRREKNILNTANEDLHKSLQELKDKNDKITSLLEMSDVMLACGSLKELSEVIAKYCGKILNFTSGMFYIMHPSKDYLETTTKWGSPLSKNSAFLHDECWALRLGHIHCAGISDTELVCNHAKINEGNQLSYLCVPLRAQSDTYGLLYVEISPLNEKPRLITDNERLLINAFAEISALALANIRLRENLRYQSIHDPLTALYNRRYLEEFLLKQIHQSERTKMPITVMMLDLDFFKRINDVHGHDAGDLILREISHLFHREIRLGDLAARYGGEEFTIILYNTSAENAKMRADNIRKAVSLLHVKYGAQEIGKITISIGVSVFPNDGNTVQELIASADKALYVAKHRGRNQVILVSEISANEQQIIPEVKTEEK